jgi:hypothetical protein
MMKEQPTISIKEAVKQLNLNGVEVSKMETSFAADNAPKITVEFVVLSMASDSMKLKTMEFQDAALRVYK